MKKVFIAVAVIGTLGLASCNKDYTCSYEDGNKTEHSNLDEDEADSARINCLGGDGIWTED